MHHSMPFVGSAAKAFRIAPYQIWNSRNAFIQERAFITTNGADKLLLAFEQQFIDRGPQSLFNFFYVTITH
jgi:hypothetical protein